jgi:hypothetical protein
MEPDQPDRQVARRRQPDAPGDGHGLAFAATVVLGLFVMAPVVAVGTLCWHWINNAQQWIEEDNRQRAMDRDREGRVLVRPGFIVTFHVNRAPCGRSFAANEEAAAVAYYDSLPWTSVCAMWRVPAQAGHHPQRTPDARGDYRPFGWQLVRQQTLAEVLQQREISMENQHDYRPGHPLVFRGRYISQDPKGTPPVLGAPPADPMPEGPARNVPGHQRPQQHGGGAPAAPAQAATAAAAARPIPTEPPAWLHDAHDGELVYDVVPVNAAAAEPNPLTMCGIGAHLYTETEYRVVGECGHMACKTCLREWYNTQQRRGQSDRNITCPFCKTAPLSTFRKLYLM